MIESGPTAAAFHALFEYAGMAAGVAFYRTQRQRAGLESLTAAGTFAIVAGLLLGAALGNKIVFFVDRPDVLAGLLNGVAVWPGQSIVGGLLGGLIGVEAAKFLTEQRQSTGDLMVWPIAIGLAIGRIGCFVAGLHDDTYGLPTGVPWGIDFGDGTPRHPTQLYEIVFVLSLAALLHFARTRTATVPGLQFKLFLFGYLAWRVLIDGFKPVLFSYPGGLSGIQWICLVAMVAYAPFVIRDWLESRRESAHLAH